MTLVQAQIPEAEYRLLRQRALATKQPMKEIVRQALHAFLTAEKVNPNDPIYRLFPLGESKGSRHNLSVEHDEALYGPDR